MSHHSQCENKLVRFIAKWVHKIYKLEWHTYNNIQNCRKFSSLLSASMFRWKKEKLRFNGDKILCINHLTPQNTTQKLCTTSTTSVSFLDARNKGHVGWLIRGSWRPLDQSESSFRPNLSLKSDSQALIAHLLPIKVTLNLRSSIRVWELRVNGKGWSIRHEQIQNTIV